MPARAHGGFAVRADQRHRLNPLSRLRHGARRREPVDRRPRRRHRCSRGHAAAMWESRARLPGGAPAQRRGPTLRRRRDRHGTSGSSRRAGRACRSPPPSSGWATGRPARRRRCSPCCAVSSHSSPPSACRSPRCARSATRSRTSASPAPAGRCWPAASSTSVRSGSPRRAWRELARTAALAFVLADFARPREPAARRAARPREVRQHERQRRRSGRARAEHTLRRPGTHARARSFMPAAARRRPRARVLDRAADRAHRGDRQALPTAQHGERRRRRARRPVAHPRSMAAASDFLCRRASSHLLSHSIKK